MKFFDKKTVIMIKLKQVSETKRLGIIIDNKLEWQHSHIEKITKKLDF